jgi:hypothetical protein
MPVIAKAVGILALGFTEICAVFGNGLLVFTEVLRNDEFPPSLDTKVLTWPLLLSVSERH